MPPLHQAKNRLTIAFKKPVKSLFYPSFLLLEHRKAFICYNVMRNTLSSRGWNSGVVLEAELISSKMPSPYLIELSCWNHNPIALLFNLMSEG